MDARDRWFESSIPHHFQGLINANIGECVGISIQGWQTHHCLDHPDHHCPDDFLRVRENAQKKHGDSRILYIVRQDRSRLEGLHDQMGTMWSTIGPSSVAEAKMVDATDCESVYCGFEFHLSPHKHHRRSTWEQPIIGDPQNRVFRPHRISSRRSNNLQLGLPLKREAQAFHAAEQPPLPVADVGQRPRHGLLAPPHPGRSVRWWIYVNRRTPCVDCGVYSTQSQDYSTLRMRRIEAVFDAFMPAAPNVPRPCAPEYRPGFRRKAIAIRHHRVQHRSCR